MILGKARIFGASPVPHVIAPQAQQVVPRQGQGTAIGGLEAEVLEASLASSGWLEPFESISYITRYHKISIYHNLSIDIIKKKKISKKVWMIPKLRSELLHETSMNPLDPSSWHLGIRM
jgi:hypothetical protein